MKRNIITCILSYIVAAIFYFMSFIWGGYLLFLPASAAVFFFAGRLYLLPTGDNRVDCAVYYPSIFVFIALMISYIVSPEPNKNIDYYVAILTVAALVSVAPSFLIWLGMISNKKKLLKIKENRESDEWNPNEW